MSTIFAPLIFYLFAGVFGIALVIFAKKQGIYKDMAEHGAIKGKMAYNGNGKVCDNPAGT